jgi:hypothetical protein
MLRGVEVKSHQECLAFVLLKVCFFYSVNGDAEAMFHLAKLLWIGYECPHDPRKAFYWFNESAFLGFSNSMTYLGLFYANGITVERNYQLSLMWYTLAASIGPDEVAQMILANKCK